MTVSGKYQCSAAVLGVALVVVAALYSCGSKDGISSDLGGAGNDVVGELSSDVGGGSDGVVPDVDEAETVSRNDVSPLDDSIGDVPMLADVVLDEVDDLVLEVDLQDGEVTPPDNGFSPGPYGFAPFDTAGPFKVPTLDGQVDLQWIWSGGEDSYVFMFYHPDYEYATGLWGSSPKDLLKASPTNVHYFFLSYTNTPMADVEALKVRFDEAISELGMEALWEGRLHFVTVMPVTLVNWLGDFVKSKGYFAFAIDRFQRIREVGLLANVVGSGVAEMKYLAQEAIYFNFEWEREQKLASVQSVKVVSLFEGQELANDGFVDVVLPSAEEMEQYDTLEFDLTLGCKEKSDDNCGEWDYLANLYLCSKEEPDKCDVEIGRWITAYHRGGRWVTDASAMLALLKDGGTRRFRLNVSWQTYVTSLSFRLSNAGKGARPVAWHPLWSGGAFDLTYNPSKEPKSIVIPATAKRVELYALITGHGFGADTANCAEFCNHTHHFFVNEVEYEKTHPMAGVGVGCQVMVKEGVVPNQFGTWPFGRSGWCPGWDVKPFVADVTAAVKKGQDNLLTYKALYFGKDYDPKVVEGGDGFAARLDVTTYLVVWE